LRLGWPGPPDPRLEPPAEPSSPLLGVDADEVDIGLARPASRQESDEVGDKAPLRVLHC